MTTLLGPTSHSYISQRLKLHYVDWGNPEAPPLLLIHGGRDHCRSWDWVAEELRHDWHIICPDLRGHGDSQWSTDGNYGVLPNVFDIAQLVDQLGLAPITIIAHSFGGNIALRYTGLYPGNVRKLIAIEGIGPSPKMMAERKAMGFANRARKWIEDMRGNARHQPKRYATLEDAFKRMIAENSYLTEEQARHLTIHAVSRNEDGTYSWKFDPYNRTFPAFDVPEEDIEALWGDIICPTLLMYGEDSWASNPEKDGRAQHFNTARVISFENAGHWLHHDQFERFLKEVRAFL